MMNDIGNTLDLGDSKEAIGESLLRFCKCGNYKQVVYVFDKFSDNPGFDINCRDRDRNTLLILAAKQGHGSIVQELLSHMPDITLVNKKNQSVVDMGTNHILKLIFGCVSTNMMYNDRLFCNACWLCNIEVVERCLVRDRKFIHNNLTNLDGVHCLLLTICNLQLIETHAARINWPFKPVQVILALLNHFTDTHPVCRTFLHIVSKSLAKSSLGIVRILLQRSFDVLSTDESGFTAIHFAARSGNEAVLDTLLNHSKYNTLQIIDVISKGGHTPLHLAAMEGRETCVKILLGLGASKDLTNDSGYTAMQMSKSARIKNIFLASDKPNKQLFLSEGPLVLSRSATAVPHTPAYNKSFCFGKKSAEPSRLLSESSLLRKNSLLIDSDSLLCLDDPTSSSLDDTILQDQSIRFPLISSRSTMTPDKCKSKVTHSISLDCLEEEDVFVDSGENLHTSNHETYSFPIRDKISNGKMLTPIKANSKPLRKSRKAVPQIPKIDPPKPLKSKLTPFLNKVIIQNKKSKEKIVKKETPIFLDPLPIENIEILSDNEAIYESDFNTDNSSMQDDFKDVSNIEFDSEEDELNNTLSNSNSSGTHISWRKGEQLGKGSYGTVWKGMMDDGQYIAVKEIIVTEADELSEYSINSSVEIKREIDILQTLRHKNIVKYLGACDSHTCIHIFMEFVSGGSIAYILSKFGGFSENIVRIYTKQVVDALTFLNLNEIIHRDIKAANVMVTPKGIIKLIDFGCAKKMQNLSSISRSTQNQSRIHGSVYWMAPEVINGNGHSHRSDIWSLGCTVVEMITTRPPWSELHPFAAMFAIGSGSKNPPDLRDYHCEDGSILSENASDFINMCFIRDRAMRPKSAELLNCAFLK